MMYQTIASWLPARETPPPARTRAAITDCP